MKSFGFALSARDGLFFKDGRGWYTSDVGRSHALPWPLPPTLRAALRAAAGREWMEQQNSPLSPEEWESQTQNLKLERVVALRRPPGETSYAQQHRLWPAPADAFYDGEHVKPLKLRAALHASASLASYDDIALDSLLWPEICERNKKPDEPKMFWSDASMMAWLRGEELQTRQAYSPELRDNIHVTIDAQTQAAAASLMFSSQVIEPMDSERYEWAIGLLGRHPEHLCLDSRALLLGGRRRPALKQSIDRDLFDAPKSLPDQSKGMRWILATPAEFQQGMIPDGFEPVEGRYQGRCFDMDLILRAALVPRPVYLSTWDMVKRAPRKTRSLAPAGSVYYVEQKSGQAFAKEDFEKIWLQSIGMGREEGLGLVLPGVWEGEGNKTP